MTPSIVQIPEVNQFRFVPLNGTLDPKYHLPRFNEDWHRLRLREWDRDIDYVQKVQLGDDWNFQFHGFEVTGSKLLKLIDAHGREWATFSPTWTETMPGNAVTVGGTDYDLDTYHYKYNFADVSVPGLGSIPAGRYWLTLALTFDDADPVSFILEPMDIAEDWPNTNLIEYRDTRNVQHTLFDYEDIKARFAIRVEGHIYDLNPESSDTTYEDQQYDPVNLSSTPYRSWTFGMGYPFGVAEWMMDKVNRALSCNRVRIEGTPYTKAPGAKWEVGRSKFTPLVHPSISVREASNAAAAVFINLAPLVIFQRPATGYPYAILRASLGDGGGLVQVIGATVIDDIDDERAVLLSLRTTVRNLNDYEGNFYFDETTGVMEFRNGYNEYLTEAEAEVKPFLLTLTKDVTAPTVSTTFSFTGQGAVVDWGEGSPAGFGSATPAAHSPAKVYVTTGVTRSIRFFHDDAVTIFSCVHTKITAVSGDAPADLTSFTLNSGELTVFDAAILTPAVASLATLNVSLHLTLDNVNNMAQNWLALNAIDFSNNSLSTGAVDVLFVDFEGTAPVSGGTILTMGQTPPAPPSGGSLAARTSLTGTYSWTVTTD